ncbi:MAG: magnesium/cobalt transporter CorA [Marinobacter sp.]|nr:magnesium/cobalt transporter CorA [Marinobacter sp.]
MSRGLVTKRGKKPGTAPGTLIHTGKKTDHPIRLRVVDYNDETLTAADGVDMAACATLPAGKLTRWLRVEGVHDPALIETLGNGINLHPLVMEDILNTDQRAKIEDYDHYVYLVMRMLHLDPDTHQVRSQQLSLILGEQLLISLQEHPDTLFDQIETRLRAGKRMRFLQSDYLAYALVDAVVDNYFVVLEQLGEQIESLEEELIAHPTPATLARIHHFKREMLLLRKSIWPLREVISRLARDENDLVRRETQVFLRDVYDHTIHVLDIVDTLRELLVGMLDLYLSSISNRMNEIMKVLTIIATVFMPLTFIAGVYGMNFEVMPELGWTWAYPVVLVAMAGIGGGLMRWFWRKGWLRQS